MSVSITVAALKSNYLQKLTNVTTYDAVLQSMIDDAITQAIDFLDDEDITNAATMPATLKRPLMKQIAYEFSRRQDLGLVSSTAPDGTVSKMEIEEWLSDVKVALDRHRHYEL